MENQPFKISIEQYGEKITFEVPNSDITLDKALNLCVKILIAAGYNAEEVLERIDVEY